MRSSTLGKRKRKRKSSGTVHPYLTGNFAPIQQTCPLTPCTYVGTIPLELLGGQYVRNGSNPVSNQELGREAHWFDGDGMLSGVLFKRTSVDGNTTVQPEFVNQYILTDVLLSAASTPSLRRPILPSIATLVNPLSSLIRITLCILRALVLVILSRLPGSRQIIKKISVANTSIMYHDGRALATCESGPPLRIALPTLDTVGWFDGNIAEGEPLQLTDGPPFGGNGLFGFMKEWTTAHPKVDPETNEMVLFHSNFAPPYVHYSIIPATQNPNTLNLTRPKLINKPVAGISSAKMMHDFGVSKCHTVIMDLPLSLDPLQIMKNKAPISYDSFKASRFGIFQRRSPSEVRWFETNACCIFHTVNTWDSYDSTGQLVSVDMLACRMTSAAVVFSAGNIAAPQPTRNTTQEVFASIPEADLERNLYEKGLSMDVNELERLPLLRNSVFPAAASAKEERPYEEDQCRLYYYSFSMECADSNSIAHQYALSRIPFEFPSVRPDRQMSFARYIYGCTTTEGNFSSSLGRTAKINAFVKFDAQVLLARAKTVPLTNITGCVDNRTVQDIVASPWLETDPIQVFQAPSGYFGQEPRFAPCSSSSAEDAGFLLAYLFNEDQLGADGQPPPSAVSELWVIDAKGMKDVLARVHLPQRVPYGLHGSWFSEDQILGQRPVETTRKMQHDDERVETRLGRMGRKVTNTVIRAIGG